MVAKQNNALQIAALDEAAVRFGLEIGLPLANARAVCPDMQIFDTDETADAQTLSDIADWCDRFTPLVALDPPHGLFLDITGCAHLFGGEASLMQKLCDELTRLGFIVSAAVAGTSVCARTISHHVHGRIVGKGEEAAAIKSLPIYTLGADDTTTRALRRAGLKTIGDVASRAPAELAARFGAAFTTLLACAQGESDQPISPRKPLPDYIVEKRFAEPVVTDTVIAAALSGLGHMLISAMERHGKGARTLEAQFFRTDGIVRTIMVEAGQPVTKAAVIDRLFREKFDALADPLDPGFGFDLVRLSARRTDLVVQQQNDLDSNIHNNDELAALIDRIAARIGGRRILVHLPADTHIPERASMAVPAQRALASAAQAVWQERIVDEPPLRPLRLFARPEPIEVTALFPDGPPAQFKWRRSSHVIARSEGPERLAMEWWSAQNDTLTRDYFRAEDKSGQRFWLYREGVYRREVMTFKWFLHGLFA